MDGLTGRIAKRIGVFALHEFIATFGVLTLGAVSVASVTEIPRLWGHVVTGRYFHSVLTENPYYPVQLVVGLVLGWINGYRLQSRLIRWVWLLPFCLLSLAFVALSTVSSLAFQARLSHFFGYGCRPEDRCSDQLAITLPFYAATAYSVGAIFAQTLRHSDLGRQRQSWFTLIVGVVFLAATGFDFVQSVIYGSQSVPPDFRWLIVVFAALPAAIAVDLIVVGKNMLGTTTTNLAK